MNVLVLTDNCVLSSSYRALFRSRVVRGEPVDVDFHGFPLWGEEDVEKNFASCNGLVCIKLFNVDAGTSQYLVWNPSTKSYKNIPSPTSTPDSFSCWFRRFGFGHDYSTDDYKIVRPYQTFHIDVLQTEIFSLKTFTWRTILVDEDNNCNRCIPYCEKTIYCNGAIYWTANLSWLIIYFDLADETFHELPWPESVSYFMRYESWELGTLREHLCLSVCTGESCNDLCIQLWVMKESWTRLVTIPYRGTRLRPICVSKNGEKVLLQEKVKKCWTGCRMQFQVDSLQFEKKRLTEKHDMISSQEWRQLHMWKAFVHLTAMMGLISTFKKRAPKVLKEIKVIEEEN